MSCFGRSLLSTRFFVPPYAHVYQTDLSRGHGMRAAAAAWEVEEQGWAGLFIILCLLPRCAPAAGCQHIQISSGGTCLIPERSTTSHLPLLQRTLLTRHHPRRVPRRQKLSATPPVLLRTAPAFLDSADNNAVFAHTPLSSSQTLCALHGTSRQVRLCKTRSSRALSLPCSSSLDRETNCCAIPRSGSNRFRAWSPIPLTIETGAARVYASHHSVKFQRGGNHAETARQDFNHQATDGRGG